MASTKRCPISAPNEGISRRAFNSLSVLSCAAALTDCRCPSEGRAVESTSSSDASARGTSDVTIVDVDLDEIVGAFARLSGVQGSPHPIALNDVDHRERFRDHHIANVRFPQDCPPNKLTLSGIFPDEGADTEDPGSYHFGTIDPHIEAARSADAEILWQSSYDVGTTDRWMGINLGGRPPDNLDRWSRVVTRCLEHFNNGWADGFESAVRQVEFINEPDGLGGFRGDQRRHLIPAFERFLQTIERYNHEHPESAVTSVGPGIPLCYLDWPRYRPGFEKILTSIRDSGLSLPVFSFHTYGDDVSPVANARLARELRALLDRFGMQSVDLWNTEWQAGGFLREHLDIGLGLVSRWRRGDATEEERQLFGAGLATYALSCKIRWQGVVTGSYYYRANARVFPRAIQRIVSGAGLGTSYLFTPTGEVNHLALQEELTHRIAEGAPLRCSTRWSDDGEIAALGLRTDEPRRADVLLCNLSPRARSFEVRVRGAWTADARLLGETTLESMRANLHHQERPIVQDEAGVVLLSTVLQPLASRLLRLS